MKRLLAFLSFIIFSSLATAGAINLNTWTATPGGTWNVVPDGSTVLQTTNGQPTYLLSDTNYINTKFDGKFGVETGSDDDFIGFVFGYNNSTDFLLFDWKQGNQAGASSGFTLSRISGSDVDYWLHTGTDINVLASDYNGNNGWADFTSYDFTLNYTSTSIKIDVGGNEIFNLTGSFSDGKFGFYNYSQAYVRYQGFEETVIPSVPEPSAIALIGLGLLGLAATRRKIQK